MGATSGSLRYFVKCRVCDQTFWLASKSAPLPDHGPWNRRVEARPSGGRGCAGAGHPGLWIGENLDGGPVSPPDRPARPTPDTSPEP